ncbi:hypothetical protein FJ420_14765 [Mesorhizobium sp. B3-1-3]|uniref:hypothetical protein n=1 Tax=unclassified Mesorhizobium TaxID=325217 RepID=UPI0011290AEA|nr:MULTISPECIES: hypothetical protein [unclassified Mesorhizobium]TPI61770.1 hypothetical protein FJ424_21510 [Mesorhizobium sp. B3-1-8]TPI71150.1 hypothetical protein FJ420_14765 [Mesorhizobium sp. B3-1-3]
MLSSRDASEFMHLKLRFAFGGVIWTVQGWWTKAAAFHLHPQKEGAACTAPPQCWLGRPVRAQFIVGMTNSAPSLMPACRPAAEGEDVQTGNRPAKTC